VTRPGLLAPGVPFLTSTWGNAKPTPARRPYAAIADTLRAFILPALGPFAWLRDHTVGVFASACSLAAAYIAGNVIMDRGHGDGGNGA
jgi:hypothetical protein